MPRLIPQKKQPEPVFEPDAQVTAWSPFMADIDGSRYFIERDVTYRGDHPAVLAYPDRFTANGMPPIQWAFR
jgi:hypothetical protein